MTFQGQVTSPVLGYSFGTKPLSLTVSEIFNGECNSMIEMTLIRPLNKSQGHSFWYQSIDSSYMTSYRLPIVGLTFAPGCTVYSHNT